MSIVVQAGQEKEIQKMGIRQQAEGRSDVWTFDPEKLVIVGIDNDNQDQLSLFDGGRSGESIPEEMIQSIVDGKVYSPILIVWRNNQVEVVNGRRRARALREANKRLEVAGLPKKFVRAIVEDSKDDEALITAMYVSNAHVLMDTPSVKAEGIKRWMGTIKDATEEKAAAIFGVTRQSINNYLRLGRCCEEVQAAVDAKKVRFRDVLTIHKLDLQEQLKELQRLIKKRKNCDNDEEGEGEGKGKGEGGGEGEGGGGWNRDGNVTMRKPRKNTIDKVIELATEKDEFDGTISAEVVATLKWVVGTGEADDVPGLTDILAHIDT